MTYVVTARITAVLALIGCSLLGLTTLAQVVFWGPTQDYETCVREALTDRALSTCGNDYLERIGGSGS